MDISLLRGWFPWTVQLLAVVLLGVALGKRRRPWLKRRLPVLVGIGVVAVLALWFFFGDAGGPGNPLLYQGDAAAYNANDPLTVLASRGEGEIPERRFGLVLRG